MLVAVGFIEHIVSPSFELGGDLLETLSTIPPYPREEASTPNSPSPSHHSRPDFRVWKNHLMENTAKWRIEEKSATIMPGNSVKLKFFGV